MEGSAEKYLEHHGILGMKWGVRRYQNKDGTLTKAGRKRYLNDDGSYNDTAKKEIPLTALSNKELQERTDRYNTQVNYLSAKQRYEEATAKKPSKAAEALKKALSDMASKMENKAVDALSKKLFEGSKDGGDDFTPSIDFSKEFDAKSLNGLSPKQMQKLQQYVANASKINEKMSEIYNAANQGNQKGNKQGKQKGNNQNNQQGNNKKKKKKKNNP